MGCRRPTVHELLTEYVPWIPFDVEAVDAASVHLSNEVCRLTTHMISTYLAERVKEHIKKENERIRMAASTMCADGKTVFSQEAAQLAIKELTDITTYVSALGKQLNDDMTRTLAEKDQKNEIFPLLKPNDVCFSSSIFLYSSLPQLMMLVDKSLRGQ